MPVNQTKRAGQTLIIALVVMGALLIIGLIFLGIVSRGVNIGTTARKRTQATRFAEAGINYCKAKLTNSEEHADWRPILDPSVNSTDPDYKYLRPAASTSDLGGPDNKGAYARVNFDGGRALVRVRYEPADVFGPSNSKAFRKLASFRNYLIIESVGRTGRINKNDPTLQGNTNPEEDRLVGLAYMPTISNAMYVGNVNQVTRPVEMGVPSDAGIYYYPGPSVTTTNQAKVQPPIEYGTSLAPFDFGNPPIANPNRITAFGSVYVNGNLKIHGPVRVALSNTLGDALAVSGTISGEDDSSSLSVLKTTFDQSAVGNKWISSVTSLTNASNPSLNSSNDNFSTLNGVVRDGAVTSDADGYSRGVATMESPSVSTVDPETGELSYVKMTRKSGIEGPGIKGNTGEYGLGRGIYIGNFADRQDARDEAGRQASGSNLSLLNDIMNPNNGSPNSGWKGNFYIPVGAFLQLRTDGFSIRLDQKGPVAQRTFKNVDGTDTGQTVCHYRLFQNGNSWLILNSVVSPDYNSSTPDMTKALPFNGVLYFAGNVRTRGVIPTDCQLHVVSGASIYIEGSITKGYFAGGSPIDHPSRSCLGLSARDNVILNTTMLVGPATDADVDPVKDVPNSVTQKPIRMRADGVLPLNTELILDPYTLNGTGRRIPFALNYREFNNPDTLDWGPDADMSTNNGRKLYAGLLLSHSMDEGSGSNSFLAIGINGADLFFRGGLPNSAASYAPYTGAASIPMWGLGSQPYQRYTKFETISVPMFNYTGDYAATLAPYVDPISSWNSGTYAWNVNDTQTLRLRGTTFSSIPTNDYLLNRALMVPGDVRIEAQIFAENGSWIVIPGRWFNENDQDRRQVFNDAVVAYGGFNDATAIRRAQAERLANFGNAPEVPFYGEPVDVRIRIDGSISQNMPPPISVQAEWIKKWGWIPHQLGCAYNFSGGTPSPILIPQAHVPRGHGYDLRPTGSDPSTSPTRYVPNLLLSYDPMFATGRADGFNPNTTSNAIVRTDAFGRPLPPIPRLPISPTLAYFGEAK